ncbi:TPA: TIGR03759 family integrating conjugative element protein [Salmonella enterica subsp. salamae serovar 51:c:-]|nr:TIGR03759 family integrating conjugative element protein [Salmonella enterica subsp. salamae serovar 51:c:-]
MRRYLLLCLLLLPLFAIPQQTRIEEQTITHTQAQQWGLTDSEWQHYQQLRQGERGIWSPGLDPLTTLGVEANSDTERQRFAELLARKEHQRVEKELAFQRAYNQAWKRLYPTLTPIRNVIQPRLALFVSEKCPACETLAQKLINDDRPLDIWLVNSLNDDASLQRWAQRQHIDMRKVERGQITLNHDNGRWQRLGGGKLPLLLEQQGSNGVPYLHPDSRPAYQLTRLRRTTAVCTNRPPAAGSGGTALRGGPCGKRHPTGAGAASVAVDAEYCRNRLPLPQPFFSLPGIARLRPYPKPETHRRRAGTD